MDAADPADAEDAFAALLHRLASPLGAIANYAYLLPAEGAPEAREGILAAMASVRGTLKDAQRWLDALATTRDVVPEGGVDLGAELAAAAERRTQPVRIAAPALPRVAVPYAAAARLADALLADAAEELRVEVAPGDGVHLVITPVGRAGSEAEAARALDLFPPRNPGSNEAQGELAVVAALARRLGGRAWGARGSGGQAVLHLVLPAGGHDVGRPPEENQNA